MIHVDQFEVNYIAKHNMISVRLWGLQPRKNEVDWLLFNRAYFNRAYLDILTHVHEHFDLDKTAGFSKAIKKLVRLEHCYSTKKK